MQGQNESKAHISLTFERLIQEWNICGIQTTKVKPIQLARSLSV
jgi:hypothetical protein